jgi:hypothetical protein
MVTKSPGSVTRRAVLKAAAASGATALLSGVGMSSEALAQAPAVLTGTQD